MNVKRLIMPREAIGTRDYEISSAVPEDIPDIVTLQDPNVNGLRRRDDNTSPTAFAPKIIIPMGCEPVQSRRF